MEAKKGRHSKDPDGSGNQDAYHNLLNVRDQDGRRQGKVGGGSDSAATINFIESNLSQAKKQKDELQALQEKVMLRQEDYWVGSTTTSKANATAGRNTATPWNTGTKDLGRFRDRVEYPVSDGSDEGRDNERATFQKKMEESQLSASQIQKKKNNILEEYNTFKKQKNQEIGEMARYERDSEKSAEDEKKDFTGGLYSKVNSKLKREALKNRLPRGGVPESVKHNSDGSLPAGRVDDIVKTCLQDPETARREQKVKAMRLQEERELLEKEQIFLDEDDEEAFHRQKPKVSKSSQLRAQIAQEQAESVKQDANSRQGIEKDVSKWAGTGLEDMVEGLEKQESSDRKVQQYQDPIEKKKTKKKQKKEQKKKQAAEASAAEDYAAARLLIAEQVPSDTLSDKSSHQQQYSLFPKSAAINLPQQQTKVLYNLQGPLLINKNFDVCPGHQYFGFGVPNDVHEAMAMKRRQEDSSSKQKSREQQAAYQKQKDGSKKQIVTASKFYTLKESQRLPCHFSHNPERVLAWKQGQAANMAKELPRVYNNGASDIADATFHGSGPAGRRAAANFGGGQSAAGRASIGKGPSRAAAAATNEASIPSVKEWFTQLTLPERVLCMTTVDANITSSINSMFKQLRTVSTHDDHVKFRLMTAMQTYSMEVTDRTQKAAKQVESDSTNGPCTWSMVMCNKAAHPSTSEKKEAERKLLSYIRVTDTAQMHDTLTVKEELLKDPEYFYKLAQDIVGYNYLKCPHEINWLDDKSAFLSKQPPWFEMWQPNSLAAWILYYLERAMCIQWEHNIYGHFQPHQQFIEKFSRIQSEYQKASKRDLIFMGLDKQFIGDEMRPSWRTFCAEVAGDASSQQLQQFLEMLKNQALQKFGVVESQAKAAGDRTEVNKFHGGIVIHGGSPPQDNSHTAQLIDDYVDRVKHYIISQAKEGVEADSNKLDLSELCMDQLLSTSAIVDNAKKSLPEIAEVYNINCAHQHPPEATAAVARREGQHPTLHDTYQMNEYHIAKIHMEMRLERLMAESFKEFRNQRLLSGHKSKNKKLQKKKLKRKLQKEQEEEQERQRQEQQKKEEEEQAKQKSQSQIYHGSTASPDDRIKVNNSAAVQLLLGNQDKSSTSQEQRKRSAQSGDKSGKELAVPGGGAAAASKPQHPVDPFNYFQVFDQQQPQHAALLGRRSHCDVTTKTISTCAESKQIEQKAAANLFQKQSQELDTAMSNEEILALQQRTSSNNGAESEGMEKARAREGNAKYGNRDWQRKTNSKNVKVMDEIIGELMSESSSVGKQRHDNAANIQIIDVAVKGNKMHAHESHLGTDNEISEDCVNDDAQSSYSSKKDTNRMIIFKKTHHRDVKPHKMPRSPSSSNGEDHSRHSSSSDQDLLPDVYAQFDPQPDDNDSSDYGAEEPLLATAEDEEAKSLADDGSSSMVYEKSMHNPSSIQTRSALQKAAKFSDKKSIHTAHPKIEGGRQLVANQLEKGCSKKQGKRRKIDFYEHGEQQRQAEDADEDLPQAVITRQKPIKLPIIPTCTIQLIELEKSQQSSGEVKPDPKSKKKSKKQRQQEYLNYISEKQSSPEQTAKSKQIEIIKPEPVAAVHSKKKKNAAELQKDAGQGNEKKKKKKAPAQEDAMNSFILKLQGEPSEPQKHEAPAETPAATLPKRGKKDSFVKQPRHSDLVASSEPPAGKTAAAVPPDTLGGKTTSHKVKEPENNDNVQAPDEKFWKQLDKTEKDDRRTSRDLAQKDLQQEDQNPEAKSKVESGMTKTALTTKSQEFKVSKKTQSQVLTESPLKKVEEQSPLKKTFSSLQEALEYNQHKLQESKSSTLSGYGSKSKKSQVEQTTANLQAATAGSDKLKTSSKGATSAKDHTSDKSQQSSKPKSKKKKRKKHDTKGGLQLQQSWIDNETGQTVYMPGNGLLPNMAPGVEPPFGPQIPGQFGMDGSGLATDGFLPGGQPQSYQQLQQHLQKVSLQMQQQSAAGFNPAFPPPMPTTGAAHPLLGGLGAPNLEQVKELLFQIQEQYMVQQQMQMAEMQRRQIEEEEMQLKEDCEPCAEDNEERSHRFFEELGEQMMAKVKEIDMLKDSVRKEREGFIKIVEQMVKDAFSNRDGNGYVGIKMFGSMVTDLAIETSDVDLVVTGINTSHVVGAKEIITPKEHVLRIMQKLYDNIVGLRSTGQIQKIKFIREATVPIIKLVADLQVINQIQTEKAKAKAKKEWEEQRAMEESNRAAGGDGSKKAGKPKPKWDELTLKELGIEAREIDPRMRYLQVDISIDEQSDCQVEVTRKHGIPVAPTQASSIDPLSAAAGGDPRMGLMGGQMYQTGMPPPALRGHNGIDTIYHIQELQKARKHLRPIVMIIKKIFDETYLSMPFFGGLSSYSLVLMVSAYLKRFDEGNSESLSRNLSGFFHFYGCYFKPHEFYLDGDNLKFEEIKRPLRDPFIVLDPLDRSNNIGRGSFRIKDVQRALVQAFKIISKSCEEYQKLEEPESADDSSLADAQCLPKNVLQRLLTEIREQHFQYSVWSDDEI